MNILSINAGSSTHKLSLFALADSGIDDQAAVRDGVSIDTTMGFTPTDGLIMVTRSGSIGRGDERASLAFDAFIHSLSRHIGAMVASFGGIDGPTFTGGIGDTCARGMGGRSRVSSIDKPSGRSIPGKEHSVIIASKRKTMSEGCQSCQPSMLSRPL